jgi:hypothetical protein
MVSLNQNNGHKPIFKMFKSLFTKGWSLFCFDMAGTDHGKNGLHAQENTLHYACLGQAQQLACSLDIAISSVD